MIEKLASKIALRRPKAYLFLASLDARFGMALLPLPALVRRFR